MGRRKTTRKSKKITEKAAKKAANYFEISIEDEAEFSDLDVGYDDVTIITEKNEPLVSDKTILTPISMASEPAGDGISANLPSVRMSETTKNATSAPFSATSAESEDKAIEAKEETLSENAGLIDTINQTAAMVAMLATNMQQMMEKMTATELNMLDRSSKNSANIVSIEEQVKANAELLHLHKAQYETFEKETLPTKDAVKELRKETLEALKDVIARSGDAVEKSKGHRDKIREEMSDVKENSAKNFSGMNEEIHELRNELKSRKLELEKMRKAQEVSNTTISQHIAKLATAVEEMNKTELDKKILTAIQKYIAEQEASIAAAKESKTSGTTTKMEKTPTKVTWETPKVDDAESKVLKIKRKGEKTMSGAKFKRPKSGDHGQAWRSYCYRLNAHIKMR